MISVRYEEAFRSLTPEELDRVVAGLARTRPELYELGDMEDGGMLLDYCRAGHISQAEVIMGMASDPSPLAVMAVERLCMRPMDRRSPREVELERDAARPRPVVAAVPQRSTQNDDRVIRLLVTTNPKRPGTSSHDRFARYRDGMTVAQFVAAGGTTGDLTWDQTHSFIRLDPPV